VVLTAPVLGVVVASLSGGAIGFTVTMLWELGRCIRDVIHIWRYPYDDRRFPESDIHRHP
jgi:hypothetical protein